jgi:hypothetical protein
MPNQGIVNDIGTNILLVNEPVTRQQVLLQVGRHWVWDFTVLKKGVIQLPTLKSPKNYFDVILTTQEEFKQINYYYNKNLLFLSSYLLNCKKAVS